MCYKSMTVGSVPHDLRICDAKTFFLIAFFQKLIFESVFVKLFLVFKNAPLKCTLKDYPVILGFGNSFFSGPNFGWEGAKCAEMFRPQAYFPYIQTLLYD